LSITKNIIDYIYALSQQLLKTILNLFILLFLFSGISALSQELPPVINFTSKDYRADNQNWAISQGEDKHIYVANSKGLLEFNGDAWTLYPSPNESIIRSVFFYDQKIYTGCYREFGFWERIETGELKYTSLTANLDIELGEDEQFWTIINYSGFLLFQSLNSIYIYDTLTGEIQKIPSEEGITKIFEAKNNIFLSKPKTGLFKLANGVTELVSDHPTFRENLIINLYEIKDKIYVQTAANGIYSLEDNPVKWDHENSDFIQSLNVYTSIQTKSGDIILGTISQGVVYINQTGEINFHITKNQSLGNNTVLSIFEDKSGNIWLGLDNGIDCINLNSPVRLFNDDSGKLGTVYAAAVFGDNLYLGTNQGLFYRSVNNNEDGRFNLIEASVGQVWSLFVYDNTLFCGHHEGTFIVENNTLNKISEIGGTWCFKTIDANPDLILQGNYEGLSLLEKANGKWAYRNTLDGFNLSSKFIEFVDANSFLIAHEYKGIYKITVDDDFSKIIDIQQDNSVEKGLYSSLVKNNYGVYYSFEKGIWKYNTKKQTFEKDTFYSKLYQPENYTSGKLVTTNNGRAIWNFTDRFINYISQNRVSNKLEVLSIPIPNSMRNAMLGYENVIEYMDDVYLFGNAQGYFLLDLKKFQNRKQNPYLSIQRVTANQINRPPFLLSLTEPIELENKNNNINFNFSIAEFEKYFTSEYQYKLKGFMDDWSPWQNSSEVSFSNLPYGSYEFLVRGRVGEYNYSDEVSYAFRIKRPFVLSNAMLLLYCLIMLISILIIHNMYKVYYKKQKRKIEVKNKRELALRESENKRELMKLKNEKLQQDIESKNRELAISTMSLIKKNEFLNSIKSELNNFSQANKDVKKVIKIIDKNLNSNDDWTFFEEAFNNADKDFFKKIKSNHPSLTPDDLRLCAYLRLNLSSKEIAPLFNISPKSVEVKRYRLRRKMNLPNETNLTNYILEI
jgi:AraC family chitin signaling transcriptional activator